MTRGQDFGNNRLLGLIPASLAHRVLGSTVKGAPLGDKENIGERDDQISHGAFRVRFEHLYRYSSVTSDRSDLVLDIGCGTGYGAAIIAERSATMAIDISDAALRYARESYKAPDFIRGSATSMPVEDGSIDVATAFEVIEHLQDGEMLVDECKRVLKRGGRLYLSSPNPAHLTNRLKKTFFGIPIPPKMYASNIYHVREFTPEEMDELLKSKGFKLVHTSGQTIVLPYIRGPFRLLGIGEVYDWLLSLLGKGFPRIAYTVTYEAVRET